jgi:hypothetical protein
VAPTTTTVAPTTTTVAPTTTTAAPSIVYWATGCCSTSNSQVTGTSGIDLSRAQDNMEGACPTGTVTNIQTGSYTGASNIPTLNCTPATTTTATPTTTTSEPLIYCPSLGYNVPASGYPGNCPGAGTTTTSGTPAPGTTTTTSGTSATTTTAGTTTTAAPSFGTRCTSFDVSIGCCTTNNVCSNGFGSGSSCSPVVDFAPGSGC